ncbi:hypothetical protein CSHISOI_07176 [Colletotrichum shisoi]|uniref:Uncharacterized protein n=1 Tax=Colletotrichum shisoi TaxID=2078593 RepID=A0A5Q4BNC7_9PEZI|nr:hypothetical protein CSHISOI_07176 [Colletotrichum shisoi]
MHSRCQPTRPTVYTKTLIGARDVSTLSYPYSSPLPASPSTGRRAVGALRRLSTRTSPTSRDRSSAGSNRAAGLVARDSSACQITPSPSPSRAFQTLEDVRGPER